MLRYITFFLTVVILVSTPGIGAAPQQKIKPRIIPPDYFPLKTGYWWQYKTITADGKQTSEFNIKVLDVEKVNDELPLYKVQTSSTQPILDWYSKPKGLVLRHREQYLNQPAMDVSYLPFKEYLMNPLTTGQKWCWSGKGMINTDIQESNEVAGFEEVVVPAGKFKAMKVITSITQGGSPVTKTCWFANWVGLIKSITDSQGIKSTCELVDYSFKRKDKTL